MLPPTDTNGQTKLALSALESFRRRLEKDFGDATEWKKWVANSLQAGFADTDTEGNQ